MSQSPELSKDEKKRLKRILEDAIDEMGIADRNGTTGMILAHLSVLWMETFLAGMNMSRRFSTLYAAYADGLGIKDKS